MSAGTRLYLFIYCLLDICVPGNGGESAAEQDVLDKLQSLSVTSPNNQQSHRPPSGQSVVAPTVHFYCFPYNGTGRQSNEGSPPGLIKDNTPKNKLRIQKSGPSA